MFRCKRCLGIFRLRYYTEIDLRDAAPRDAEPKQVWRVILLLPCGIFQRLVRKDFDMALKSYSILLAAAALIASPVVARAQNSNPTANMGSNRSATAAPGTADSKAMSGMHTGDVTTPHATTGNYSGSAMNSTTPGATGKTVVPGSTSSQASSSRGTAEQKTGAVSTGGGGGGGK